MRHYTTDSPEAMSRVVSLALLADGALDHREVESLDRQAILAQLGIADGTLDRVMHAFCDDLLQCARAPNVGQIELDRELVDHLLDDIRAPEKRQQALGAMLDIVHADRCLNGGEAILISQAMTRWGIELQEVLAQRNAAGVSPFADWRDFVSLVFVRDPSPPPVSWNPGNDSRQPSSS